MPKKEKAVKAVTTKKAKSKVVKKTRRATPKAKTKTKPKAKKVKQVVAQKHEMEQLVSSEVVYEGKLFKVLRDRLIEPGGAEACREVIRHHGSVVVLALDSSKSKKDPWVVMERQYRHAARQFLWELPAGKLDAGEDALAGAKRELEEETGYCAKKWKPLVEYFASPGFLGESMKVFVAEGLVAGEAHPEEDERIEIRLVKLSEILKMIEKGAIADGKTLVATMLYARLKGAKKR